MAIKNLTPHDIFVRLTIPSTLPYYDERGWMERPPSFEKTLCFPPEGIVPRVETVEVPSAPVEGIPTVVRKMGHVVGLPDPQEGVWYLVSSLVFEASERSDLLCPDTGKTCIRDNHGNNVAVTRFVRK